MTMVARSSRQPPRRPLGRKIDSCKLAATVPCSLSTPSSAQAPSLSRRWVARFPVPLFVFPVEVEARRLGTTSVNTTQAVP